MEKNVFLKSCVSEGLLPKGLGGKFSLALDVNNEPFVVQIQNMADIHSSGLLDKIFIQSQMEERRLESVL